MQKNTQLVFPVLIFIVFIVIFSNCASTPGDASINPPSNNRTVVSLYDISLQAPEDSGSIDYLGLTEEQYFKILQIKADIVLINVFSTTCPHCIKEVPNTNKLFHTISDRPDIKDRIKIIGIGTRNTVEDIRAFKSEYKVPFPLFPDKDMSIFNQLAATGTPTMIGVKLFEDGTHSIFFRKAGSIGDVSWFIDFLLDMARLKK